MVDCHFAAGRSGLGLCFAQKKIKYILVAGTDHCKVKDTKKLKQAREDILRLTAASPALMGRFGFTCLGTGAVYDLMDNRRMMPTDNFRHTRFEPASQLNAAMYSKNYALQKTRCLGCHIRCKKIGTKIVTKNGQRLTMPEFETMSHFTALIGCKDIDLVVNANKRCNDYGMDTISAASTLACRREITGLDYTPDDLLSLLDDIAFEVVTDEYGNVFMLGETCSDDFPTASGLVSQLNFGGNRDAFVEMFNINAEPLYRTYCGGTGDDRGFCILYSQDNKLVK